MQMWKKLWDKYIKGTTEEVENLEFPADEQRRYKIIFSGVVQGVGFRYEVWTLAKQLGLAGYAKNLANGNVLAEIQGPKNRILYVIDYMQKIPRIHIDKIEIDEMDLKDETDFQAIY